MNRQPQRPAAVVYVSARCPNCSRFLDGLRRSVARASVQVVNVDEHPTEGVQYVPTVVVSTGQLLVGTKAFEWLREHDTDAELEPHSLVANRGLAFSTLGSAGQAQFAEAFSTFIKPE